MKLFDHLNNITEQKKPVSEDDLKTYDNYMINRFVSMTEHYLPFVAEVNQYELPKDLHQTFMMAILPKRKQYFKYIKRSKKDDNKFELECLMRYYQVGPREARQYYNDLTDEQLKSIVERFHFLKD